MQVKSADNLCVICGNAIPEGRQACPNCEAQVDASANRIMSKVNDEVEQAFRQGYLAGLREQDYRIKEIAYHYGYESQREQLIEECAENDT